MGDIRVDKDLDVSFRLVVLKLCSVEFVYMGLSTDQ